MPQAKSTYIQSAVDFIRGEEGKWKDQQVPPELGNKHITELLGRHPFHPYSPEVSKDPSHMCHAANEAFYQCMKAFDGAMVDNKEDGGPEQVPMPLHMKHVSCYHPYKVDLMKCTVKAKRLERKAAEAGGAAIGSSGDATRVSS